MKFNSSVKTQEDEDMNKEAFWAIIEKARDFDAEIMYSNLVNEMSHLSKKDAFLFNSYLTGYMELIIGTIWLEMARIVINGYFSDDYMGIYFASWVISMGETVLLKVLNDPDSLAELPEIPFGNANFERLMSITMNFDESIEPNYELMGKAERKAMDEIAPTIKFKNNTQSGNYKEYEDAMKDIPNVVPNLIKRAEQEGFDWKNEPK